MNMLLEAIGLNKWAAYAMLAMTVLSAIGIAIQRFKNQGKDEKRLQDAERALERMKQNAKIKLDVERTVTSAARDRLLRNYSR